MADAELGAQPPHRPVPPHVAVPQILVHLCEAKLPQARLAPLLCDVCLRPGSQASPRHGALPPGRPHPPHLILLQQAPQGARRRAKLTPHLRQRPRLGGGEVGGELGDAPALVEEGVQASVQVGEAQPSGLLTARGQIKAQAPAAGQLPAPGRGQPRTPSSVPMTDFLAPQA
jgi:hypothetical protein